MRRSCTIVAAAILVLLAVQLACSMPTGGGETSSSSTESASDPDDSEDTGLAADQAADVPIPPIYVTVALHIEDAPRYANCDSFPDFRNNLLDFAEVMGQYEPAVNLQTDYEFLVGVSRCETANLLTATRGQTIFDYLASQYGYEIDPHQEGGWDIDGQDNYADIRYLAGQVTTAVSETMGGLVWDSPAQWGALAEGERGLQYPGFTWNPEALTLAVGSQHHLGDFSADDYASGVWRPLGAGDDFWVHDPQGPIVYIGPGEYDNWGGRQGNRSTLEFINHLLEQLEAGVLDRSLMYTATIAVPQSIIFNRAEYSKLQALLEDLAPMAASGQIVYGTYSQVIEIWLTEYGASPNIYQAP